MKENETLYDQVIRQLKNKRIVVIILIIGAVVVALSQFLGSLSTVWNLVHPEQLGFQELQVTIQPYNILMGPTGSPILLPPIRSNATNSDVIADTLMRQIADTIRPSNRENYQATLTISGSHIRSSQSIIALMTSFSGGQGRAPVQGPPVQKSIDLVNGPDLPALFADPVFLDRRCNCIHFEIQAPTTGYESTYIEVSQVQDQYSFGASSLVQTESVDLAPARSIILIEPFEGAGADPDKLKSIATSLYNALRDRLPQYSFLKLSPYRLDEVKEKAAELKDLQPGSGKEDIANQYRVDYIVTGNFVIKATQ